MSVWQQKWHVACPDCQAKPGEPCKSIAKKAYLKIGHGCRIKAEREFIKQANKLRLSVIYSRKTVNVFQERILVLLKREKDCLKALEEMGEKMHEGGGDA